MYIQYIHSYYLYVNTIVTIHITIYINRSTISRGYMYITYIHTYYIVYRIYNIENCIKYMIHIIMCI